MKNDLGFEIVYSVCYCGRRHCRGDVTITPDTDRESGCRNFMLAVTDTSGDEEAVVWLDTEGLANFIHQAQQVLKLYGVGLDE